MLVAREDRQPVLAEMRGDARECRHAGCFLSLLRVYPGRVRNDLLPLAERQAVNGQLCFLSLRLLFRQLLVDLVRELPVELHLILAMGAVRFVAFVTAFVADYATGCWLFAFDISV